MLELLRELMDAAGGRTNYAEARHVRTRAEELSTRNGRVDSIDLDEASGFGVRVRVGGAWGFAATRGDDATAARAALTRALAVAEAQPVSCAAALAGADPAQGRHESPYEQDPFAVSLDDKLAALIAADEAMGRDPRVTLRQAQFAAYREEKAFASTEGGAYEQVLTECGGGIACEAVAGEESQTRSFPGSHHGGVMQAGYERFESLRLAEQAPRVAEEAIALLTAPPCPPGRTTVILDGEQTALQIHESVGHATELDRVLGREASYAGTSFLDPAGLGSFRYGSALMNVTADATVAGGLGTAGWDDEGVAARAEPLVREGVLTGFLSSRETAAEIGRPGSAGCMRASGFDRQPIVRMTNVNLEPGDAGSLADLIADTEEGIYMETNRSWSIDNRRLNFQFATEAAWEIEGGERRRLLRNPSYAGVTPEFWSRLDAVCSRPEWRLWGVLNCGKGEPGQAVHVSHGAAPTRFRDVEVGVA